MFVALRRITLNITSGQILEVAHLSKGGEYRRYSFFKDRYDISSRSRVKSVYFMSLPWLFVGPTGVYLLDFFCSGIQFYLLLSPYLCFISLLYLDLYVLGDDALIKRGLSCKPNIYICLDPHLY